MNDLKQRKENEMKIITIIIFIILSPGLYSQVRPITEIEIGYEDRIFLLKDENGSCIGDDSDFFRNKTYTDLKIGIAYKGLNISGSTKTFMHQETLIKFRPVYMEFIFGARYEYNRFELKYEHMCAHTIDGVIWRSGYDRIGLRIKIF